MSEVAEPVKKMNKSGCVRAAIAAGITSPKEIAEYAKSKGFEVTPQYAAVIKSHAKKASGEPKVAKARKPKKAGREVVVSNEKAPCSNPVSVAAYNGDVEKNALIFAMNCGGITKAIKNVQSIVGCPAVAFTTAVGGCENAIKALNSLESLGVKV